MVQLFSAAVRDPHSLVRGRLADSWRVAVRTSMNLNENPGWSRSRCPDDPALAGFLLVDEIFAEEGGGRLHYEVVPNSGMEAILPMSYTSR